MMSLQQRKAAKKHQLFFDGLSSVEEVYVIGHSLSEVDYPYFVRNLMRNGISDIIL